MTFTSNPGRAARRGTALLIVLAMLGVIAITAIAFARVMVVERDASHTHTDAVRARFLAVAGVEHGAALVQMRLAEKPYVTSKDGIDWPSGPGVRLPDAADVSLEAGETLGYAYSGWVEPTGSEEGRYASRGLHYALKIQDTSSLVFAGRVENGEGNARVLDNLGRLLSDAGRFAVLGADLGTVLFSAQPADGFGTYDDLAGALIATYGSSSALVDDLELLRDFVTVEGWRDPDTVRPLGGELVAATADQRCHPININTAPVEILAALFTGIRGLWADPDPDAASGSLIDHAISQATAQALADKIVASRSEANNQKDTGSYKKDPFFYSHADLEAFLVEQARGGGAFLSAADVQVLVSMLNPNGRLTRFNPDLRLRYLSSKGDKKFGHTDDDDRNWTNRFFCDKSRLIQWTGEVNFLGTGLYRIGSLGRLIAVDGSILASHEIEVTIRLARRVSWTSQAEFEALLGAGASQYVRSYPESLPANTSSQTASATTGGLRQGPSDYRPASTVLAGLRPGDGAAELPAGHVGTPAGPSVGGNNSVFGANRTLRGSDGLVSAPDLDDPSQDRVRAFEGQYMPLEEGTAGFWTKLSEQGLRGSGGFFWATNDLPDNAPTDIATHDEGVHTVSYYRFDPATRRGYVHVARTFFFLKSGVPDSGNVPGLKFELTGTLKPNAYDILYQQGRALVRPRLEQLGGALHWNEHEGWREWRPWDAATLENWIHTFATFYAQRVLQAIQGGEYSNNAEVVIGHAAVEDAADLPVICPSDWAEKVDAVIPLIFDGDHTIESREWSSAAFHTVVNETDRFQYSYQVMDTDRYGYGHYWRELINPDDPTQSVSEWNAFSGQAAGFEGDYAWGTLYRWGRDPLKAQYANWIPRWKYLEDNYDKVLSMGLETRFAASRVELVKEVYREEQQGGVWVPTSDSWKPGEWHHIQFTWRDTTGYLEAYFDGLDDADTIDEWGPLNVWSSRMRTIRDLVHFGPYILDRASNDSGDTGAADRDLHWVTHATTDRLMIRDQFVGSLGGQASGNPTGPVDGRYYAEQAVDPNGGLTGSYARLVLPVATAGRGFWVDWTEYEPTDSQGDAYVKVRLYVRDGSSWVELHRLDRDLTAAERAVLQGGSVPANVEVLVVFEDQGESYDNPADVSDVTAFLDDIGVWVLTGPEILSWTVR